MDFIANLAGSLIAMWIFTRIVYIFTDRKMSGKQQAGLSFVLGILLIIILISVGWFSITFSIPYFIALLIWFILDVTEVTNGKGKGKDKKNKSLNI